MTQSRTVSLVIDTIKMMFLTRLRLAKLLQHMETKVPALLIMVSVILKVTAGLKRNTMYHPSEYTIPST